MFLKIYLILNEHQIAGKLVKRIKHSILSNCCTVYWLHCRCFCDTLPIFFSVSQRKRYHPGEAYERTGLMKLCALGASLCLLCYFMSHVTACTDILKFNRIFHSPFMADIGHNYRELKSAHLSTLNANCSQQVWRRSPFLFRIKLWMVW